MDNLRSFLSDYDPAEAHYLGYRIDWGNGTVVNLGFSFAVSKEALRLFIEESLPDPDKCFTGIRPLYKGDDDTEFGMCLKSVGDYPEYTTDWNDRRRFDVLDPVSRMDEFEQNYTNWHEVSTWATDRPISYVVTKPSHLYVLEFLTQYLKV